MARTLNGSSQYLSVALPYLSTASQFTLCLWWRPDSLTPAFAGPLLYSYDSGTAAEWTVIYNTDGTVSFAATGFTGTDPATNSKTAAFTSIDTSHGKRVLFRYDGTSWVVWTGSRTGGLVKKTIDASISFALPTLTTGATYVGYNLSTLADGGIAEVALYNVALTDADCEMLLRGVAADQVATAALTAGSASLATNAGYWPLRGVGYNLAGTTTEINYATASTTLAATLTTNMTLTGSPAAETHPPVYGRDDQTDMQAAWCAEIQHADGTIYAASTDLAEPLDVDVLGRVYPGRILNGDSVFVSKSINEGIVSPGNTTVILANDEARSPADVRGLAVWLEADQIRTAADGDAVTTWPDVSGFGLDATGGTGPTFDADGINDRPALLFDAGGEHLNTPSTTPTTSSDKYTIVVAFTRADAAASNHTVLCDSGGGFKLYTDSSNDLKAEIATGPTTITLGSVSGVDETQVASYRHAGSGVVFGRINQGAWATSSSATYHPHPIRLGANSSGAEDLDGRVAAVLVYNRSLSDVELKSIENYLAAKYASAATPHATLSPRREWRGTRVILRRYERTSHELVTELVGKIADVDWSEPGRAAFTLTGAATDVLNERIPKALINVDEHSTATDLLAPIPVGFGEFWVSAPFIAFDDTNSPGRYDFAVSHVDDADGNAMSLDIRRVLFDIYSTIPGLETANSWIDSPGAVPTKTASVTNKLDLPEAADQLYEVGTPVRVTVSAVEYYTHVTAYTAGSPNTVTLADSVVATNPTKVELLAGGYVIDKTTYTAGGADVATVRFAGTGKGGGVVVFGRNTSLRNPANVIKEILRNDVWGLDQTVDSALFAQAVTDFAAAGLSQACNHALAGDRQQRTARNAIGEILAMRGAWLDLQADGSWGLYVDKVPAWEQSRTFSMADRRFPQIQRVQSHNRTPLGSLVATLKLRFRKKGRSRSSEGVTSWIAPSDYELQVNRVVNTTAGADRIVTNPWIDKFEHAKRVVVYQGKRLAVEDEKLDVRVGPEGRNVELGEVVRLVVPHSQVDGDYRVTGYTRGLGSTTLRTVGYSPSIFDFTASDVTFDDGAGANTDDDGTAIDDGEKETDLEVNQILNANFALGMGNTYTPEETKADAVTLPGWVITEGDGGSTDISALAVSRSSLWVGRHYLSITIAGTSGDPRLVTNGNLSQTAAVGGAVVQPGEAYIVSCYAAKNGASKAADAGSAIKLTVDYYQGNGTASAVTASDDLQLRATGATTGPSTGAGPAMRWWGVTRAPSDAVYGVLKIQFVKTGTFYLGGVAFNKVHRFMYGPPPWALSSERSFGDTT